MNQNKLHNKLCGPIMRSIVKPVIDNGGSRTDILVLLESVVVGVIMAITRLGGLGGDDDITDKLAEGVKQRLAEARLAAIEPEGEA